MDQQQSLINQHKITTSILVIDKKKERIINSNLPKTVIEQFPKYIAIKNASCKSKVGPQITTLFAMIRYLKIFQQKSC